MAVQQGQYAMEVSEQEFETKINEKEEYASAVGQEAFEAVQAMGLPYEAGARRGTDGAGQRGEPLRRGDEGEGGLCGPCRAAAVRERARDGAPVRCGRPAGPVRDGGL